MGEARKALHTRALLVLLALGTGAAVTQWLRDFNEADRAPPPVSHDPDYMMENFTAIAIGPTGIPKNQLQAIQMVHYSDNDSTEYMRPHFTLYRAKGAPWNIYAGRGWMGSDHKYFLLRDAVLIENPLAAPNKMLNLVTRNMRVLEDEQYAETDEPVTIRSQTSVTTGVGMRAYVEESRLQLLSKVRGTYAARAKHKML